MQEAAKEASEAAHLAGLQAQMAAKRAVLEQQRAEQLAAGAAARDALVRSLHPQEAGQPDQIAHSVSRKRYGTGRSCGVLCK